MAANQILQTDKKNFIGCGVEKKFYNKTKWKRNELQIETDGKCIHGNVNNNALLNTLSGTLIATFGSNLVVLVVPYALRIDAIFLMPMDPPDDELMASGNKNIEKIPSNSCFWYTQIYIRYHCECSVAIGV